MRGWMMAGLLLSAAAPAWAQESGGQEAGPTIIVTGNPLSETAKRLKACLARHCPPKEDIDASLAHAENQFLEGDYRGARGTLAASHGRNARYAKDYPIDVSDLDRAYGRLTNMDGRPEFGRILQIGALDTLKGGLDSSDARILVQRLMTGDEYLQVGRLEAAVEVYRKVEKQARQLGEMRVASAAILRPAALYAALGAHDYNYRMEARRELARIERTTEPGLAGARTAARVLRARLAGVAGDKDEMEKAIGDLAGAGFTTPVLVYDEPPFGDIPPPTGVIARNLDTNPEWIDLRYRIDASGKVQDVDELRRSPDVSNDWPRYILKSIARRRYVPLALPAGSSGLVRIERFTLVFDAESSTGSNMQARSTKGRLVSLDLTPDPPAPAPGG
jgi:hypothetical protein